MSRFWAAGGSSDDSDSSSDDETSSSDDSSIGGGRNQNRWVDMSDSDSEDEVRVVKSAKERFHETYSQHVRVIRNGMKNCDYKKILSEFDDLSKAMTKAKKILAAGVPRPLVRILVELQDFVTERLADKAAFKQLSAGQGRALNRLKLNVKKHNKPYATVMEAYRKNPIVNDDEEDVASSSSDESEASSSEESSSSEEESDSDESSDEADSDSDEDESGDDDENWDSDSDESSSSDSDVEGVYSQLKGRARWLKKNTLVKEKVVKDKEARGRARAEAKEAARAAQEQALESSKATKSILPVENLTPSLVNKKVFELASSRGRRGTDTRQVLRQLEALSKLSLEFGPRVEIPILMHVVTAQFDLQRTMDDYMPTKMWKSCAHYLDRISSVLQDDGYKLGVAQVDESDLYVAKTGKVGKKMMAAASADGGAMAAVAADEKLINPHTGEEETEDDRAERLRLEKEAAMTDEEKMTIPVMGSYAMFLSRLEEEYVKSLQHINSHSPDYIARLRDESMLVELLTKGQAYYERENLTDEAASLAQLRIEHIYYRHDTIAEQVDKAAAFYKKFGEMDMLHPACVTATSTTGDGDVDVTKVHPGAASGQPSIQDDAVDKESSADLIARLCTYVYQYGTDRSKTRAMICHIYHHALHDRFLEARDLLLMSHLQETVVNSGDVSTMIMFNRMMVTLGMSAFRLGKIWAAHQCLAEICSGRVRELLAQGVSSSRFHHYDKSAEQEKAEKRRQVPYHQHINLDLLEACHLISAMLLEVPNMAAASQDRRARVISRMFRKYHDIYERQVFTGPPEQTRDFVMRASKALRKGDWKMCANLLVNMDCWKLVPGEGAAESIQTMMLEKIKLEGLRTYLFAFSSQYDSLSLEQLCEMFEMTKNEVHAVVSKMMINRELYASWDQPTETIVLRKVEPTSLQVMALQFAEKAASLVEANERLLDASSGSYGYGDTDDYRWKDRQGYQGRRDGGGRGGQRRDGGGRGGQRRDGGGGQRRGGGGRGRGGGTRRY